LDKYDPQIKYWAMLAVKYGEEAGVDPHLVMAVVLKEGATRTLEGTSGFANEYNWFGTFNTVKSAFADQFKVDDWSHLGNDNNDLNIKATAYNLKRIEDKFSGQVPNDMKAKYSLTQFLAASYYNAGDNATQGSIDNHATGPAGTDYSNCALSWFDQAQSLMCGSGAYTCT
jgi:hypothetical protein